jgi:hypothetical protein
LPRIRWWEIVVSLPVSAFGAILTVALFICQIPRTQFPLRMLLVGFGSMWLLLGASTSVAYFVQWRLRRQLTSSNVEQVLRAPAASRLSPGFPGGNRREETFE